MKVIAGIYKGRNIDTIKDSTTRPMMGIAREGIFNTLQFSFENANVLDLFAGSGSMGIEALSRGAKYVTFIDNSPDCIRQINKNLEEYKNDYSVIKLDVSNYINEVNEIRNNLNKNAFIIIHRHSNSSSIVLPNDVELYKEKNYGQSKILILRKK